MDLNTMLPFLLMGSSSSNTMLRKLMMYQLLGPIGLIMGNNGGNSNLLMMMLMMGAFGQQNTQSNNGVINVGLPAAIGTAAGTLLPILLMSGKKTYKRKKRLYKNYNRFGGFMNGFVKGLSAGRA